MPDDTGYTFQVDEETQITLNLPTGVFVPTGTTNTLIRAVRKHVNQPGKVLDLGAGSGVVGISMHQVGLVEAPLYASDLSEQAIDCMKKNAEVYHLSIVARTGSLFEPWKGETFDYIVNDISGVAVEVANLSPWFNNVPCQSGVDGTELVIKVLQEAPDHLNSGGLFFFPVISFSNANKILTVAHEKFSHIECLIHEEWPLPKEMYEHIPILNRLKEEGHIQFAEKFGMVLWSTDIYVAYHS